MDPGLVGPVAQPAERGRVGLDRLGAQPVVGLLEIGVDGFREGQARGRLLSLRRILPRGDLRQLLTGKPARLVDGQDPPASQPEAALPDG